MIGIVLLIAGLILFILASFGLPTRINLVAAGLACWLLVEIIDRGIFK